MISVSHEFRIQKSGEFEFTGHHEPPLVSSKKTFILNLNHTFLSEL